jgi:hypothetical protein
VDDDRILVVLEKGGLALAPNIVVGGQATSEASDEGDCEKGGSKYASS